MSSRGEFESHWKRLAGPAIAPPKLAEARAFLAPLSGVAGGRVLDIGCGDGVHAAVFANTDARCAADPRWHYTGVDLSLAAAAVSRSRFAARSSVPQVAVADAQLLPFGAETFDAVFSYGVLAYTGDPRAALDEMTRVARRGALIGLWLYPRATGVAGAAFAGLRRICRLLGPRGSAPIVWSIVLLLPWLPVRSGVSLRTASWRQCVEIVEVNLLPPVLEFFEATEVEQWCHDRGLEVLVTDPERPVTVWARRSA